MKLYFSFPRAISFFRAHELSFALTPREPKRREATAERPQAMMECLLKDGNMKARTTPDRSEGRAAGGVASQGRDASSSPLSVF
jgi:hypothetical protein